MEGRDVVESQLTSSGAGGVVTVGKEMKEKKKLVAMIGQW